MSSLACELEGIWDGAMNWSAQFSDSQHSLRHRRYCTLALVFTAAGMHGWWGASFDRSGGSAQLSSSIDHLRDRVKDGSSVCSAGARVRVREVSIAKSLLWNPISWHQYWQRIQRCRALAASQAGSPSPGQRAAWCTYTVHILEKQRVFVVPVLDHVNPTKVCLID